jgi:CRP-like cAMP-binding protein
VTALTPVTLLTLGADHYESLIRKYPSLKGDLACAAAEFMQKRLDALMQAQMAKISGLQHGETLF